MELSLIEGAHDMFTPKQYRVKAAEYGETNQDDDEP